MVVREQDKVKHAVLQDAMNRGTDEFVDDLIDDDELKQAVERGGVEPLEQAEMPSWAEPDDMDTYTEEVGLVTALLSEYLHERGLADEYDVRDISDRAPARPTSPLHISEDVLIVPEGNDDHNYAAAINVEYGNIWMPMGPITYRATETPELSENAESHAYTEGIGDWKPTETLELQFPYDDAIEPDDADSVNYEASDDQIELYGALAEFAPRWAAVSDMVTMPELPGDDRSYDERRSAVSFTDPRVSGPDTGHRMGEHLRRHYDQYVEQQ